MDPELLRLRRALNTMPGAERQVFERARFEGQDYPTIAADLGLRVGQVEFLLASALFHLIASEE